MGFNMKPKSPLTKKLVSALKHKPWAAAHKERPAHSGTAEAHNAEPAAPTKKYVSDAQRKAVHASKAERSPAKTHKPGHPGGAPGPILGGFCVVFWRFLDLISCCSKGLGRPFFSPKGALFLVSAKSRIGFCFFLAYIKTIAVHDFYPCIDEIMSEFLLRVILCIDFS